MDPLIPVMPAADIRKADQHTIQSEPIRSADLMERASLAVLRALEPHINRHTRIHVVCGPGNNGGDGLCIARYLLHRVASVRVSLCTFGKSRTADNELQGQLFKASHPGRFKTIYHAGEFETKTDELIVECLFGTGLSNPLEGEFLQVVERINASGSDIISVDMPAGLFDNKAQGSAAYVKARLTISIQFPKPSFFFPENQIQFELAFAGIGPEPETEISARFLSPQSPFREQVLALLPEKHSFSHKNTYGHALLVGGNTGMSGAIALATEACLLSGAGLTTVVCPVSTLPWLSHLPRAMCLPMEFDASSVLLALDKYTVLAIGPGLGTTDAVLQFYTDLLRTWNRPALFDADALNLIAANPGLWELVKPGSILTPHHGEFRRLFGSFESGETLFEAAANQAKEKGIYILCKNTYSVLFCPDGQRYYNGSGHPGLAQGGSGDKLSGLIAGLWARTAEVRTAAIQGMFRAGLSA